MDKLRETQKHLQLQLEVVEMLAVGATPQDISAKLAAITQQSVVMGATPFAVNENPQIGRCVVAVLRTTNLLAKEIRNLILLNAIRPV